jgi:hypothetical protein
MGTLDTTAHRRANSSLVPATSIKHVLRSRYRLDVQWRHGIRINGVERLTINFLTKLRGFSQQEKYADRATAACRRS